MTNKIYGVKNEFVANLILILSALYLTIFATISYYIIAIDNIYFSYILLICALSDIGGFVFGKTFRGAKLTKISPNKTISGSLGSFIFAMIPSFILKIIFLYTEIYFLSFANNLLLNLMICLFLSLVCQLGDLFISYFKRLSDVKDTGKILPGHGGLLDRIDGVIFAIPFFGILGYLLNY
jgi:phosphatidate cytidylyltransferase